MHKSKNIVHINTKAKRSQTSCFQEVWPFYSLTSVKDGIIITHYKEGVNMELKKSNKIYGDYYIGLDIGTNSVGIARVFDTLFSP